PNLTNAVRRVATQAVVLPAVAGPVTIPPRLPAAAATFCSMTRPTVSMSPARGGVLMTMSDETYRRRRSSNWRCSLSDIAWYSSRLTIAGGGMSSDRYSCNVDQLDSDGRGSVKNFTVMSPHRDQRF